MKNVVSGYVERWTLVLGLIFVLIISFMPEGLVPGSIRLGRAAWTLVRLPGKMARRSRERHAMTALAVTGLSKSFGGLRVTDGVDLIVEPGERRLIIGPNGAGKTTLFNQISGEIEPDTGTVALFGNDITRVPCRRRRPGLARTYQIVTLSSERHHPAQRDAGVPRTVALALEPVDGPGEP